ncbi:hypothetical protein CspeluHIS016_0304970 [Cutaneotrichosporon spelunceum]|uniref:Dynamin protein dnm1 n=1 Tax=Cutaneotrichosporon spelunceum TaxID=1672016 RepID=A0AAD3TTL3_9TREE|nr:hypothetical protein CspeluHIS016_0304970 [Cutaneotrichosporon spelunceum]
MDGDLIALVNKLQDTFNAIGGDAVDLPQIVVVGSQSSGKSSVLETIVGRDFLPRGQGIVTRRPLVLQLIHTSGLGGTNQPTTSQGGGSSPDRNTRDDGYLPDLSGGQSGSSRSMGGDTGIDYAEFLHLNRRFTDFDEVRREIEAETFRVAGQNKGVSKLPINLKIYGPGVLNLTLVDLPGLTKVPVGDQPSDIERQIKNLVLDYITNPNAVILAVSPANVDLANSDALKLARTVDPRGLRTLGVLTKLDLMDAGTNALDVLTGRTYPLKLGFIGVVNRSQQDINLDLPMEEARRKEEEFFTQHSVYRNISHRCGTAFLAKTLNSVLMNHIREKLPDMKARLNTLMGQTQQELNSFGDATFLGEQHRGSLILKLMTEFARDFVSSIEGTSLDISTKELCGGARIYYIFNDVFGHALQSIDPTQNLTVTDIRTAIRNSTGPRPSMFVPEVAFDLLVKPQIKLLEAPSLRCVELVYEELMKICHNSTSPELQRFPGLHAQLVEVVSELLRERLGPTSEYVSSLIQIQAAYINTNHPDFQSGTAAIARAGAQISHPPPRPPISPDESVLDGDESSSDSDAPPPVNGSAKGHHQGKGSTISVPEARNSGSKILDAAKSGHFRASSHSAPRSPQPGSAPTGLSSSQNHNASNAKETFLNYFFGGPNGPNGMGPGLSGSAHHRRGGPEPRSAGVSAHDILPDLGTRRAGTVPGGLDQANAAFDMKSLSKHIDPSEQPVHLAPKEEIEANLIRSLIANYFSIVRQAIQDLTPKAIMHLLVNFSRDAVQQRLVTQLYKPELFGELLHEDEALVAERTRVKSLLDAYKEAFRVLSEVSLKST